MTPHSESLGESECDLQCGISVVALADVEQAWKSANLSKVELVETELSAGKRENKAVGGYGFGQLSVIASAGARTVAATDQEEMADRASLHRVDHPACNAEDSIVSEANCNLFVGAVFRIAWRLKRSG